MGVKSRKQRGYGIGTLLLAIWALPFIGIPTAVILVQQWKKKKAIAPTASTPVGNERGQYGRTRR